MFYQSGAGGVRPQCSRRARQVWNAHRGYPGDPAYRDFYRDVGFDLSPEELAPFQKGVSPELNIIALPAATFR